MWRVVLLVGTILAVVLFGASMWAQSTSRFVYTTCAERPTTGSGWEKTYGCAVWNTRTDPGHSGQARYLRFAAGGVLLITLASLPLLGAARGSRQTGPAGPQTK